MVSVIGSITPTPLCPEPTSSFSYSLISSIGTNRTFKLNGTQSNGGSGHFIVEYKWYIDSVYSGNGSVKEVTIDTNAHEFKLIVENDCGNLDSTKAFIPKALTPTPYPQKCIELVSSHYDVINEFDLDHDNKISLAEKEEAKRQYLWGLLKDTDYHAVLEFYTLKCTLPDKPTPTPLPKADINAFRSACMNNGSVKCSWSTIKNWLKDRRVASIWWDLTQTERKSIAVIAIKNTLFYYTDSIRDGNDNCNGPTSSTYKAVCLHNALIRTQLFGYPVDNSKKCYYKSSSGIYKCYYSSDYYGLPAYDIELRTTERTGDNAYGHAICGILIVNNMNSYKNFILFQYNACDVKLGDWNFPDDKVDMWFRVYKPRKIEHVRKTYLHDYAEFKIY